jgi:hypothetical protein
VAAIAAILILMRPRIAVLAALLSLLPIGAPASAAEDLTEPRARVEHHLREARQIAQHFEEVLTRDCPRFETPDAWYAYIDPEIDRMVTLLAHMDEAWAEAKRTKDDEVRGMAKTPRRMREQARLHVDRLQTCAADNGAVFAPLSVWRRIERELPQRRAAIALPQETPSP